MNAAMPRQIDPQPQLVQAGQFLVSFGPFSLSSACTGCLSLVLFIFCSSVGYSLVSPKASYRNLLLGKPVKRALPEDVLLVVLTVPRCRHQRCGSEWTNRGSVGKQPIGPGSYGCFVGEPWKWPIQPVATYPAPEEPASSSVSWGASGLLLGIANGAKAHGPRTHGGVEDNLDACTCMWMEGFNLCGVDEAWPSSIYTGKVNGWLLPQAHQTSL